LKRLKRLLRRFNLSLRGEEEDWEVSLTARLWAGIGIPEGCKWSLWKPGVVLAEGEN